MESVYTVKENCCGCGACSLVCSQKAITMEEDKEGFLYPKIAQEKCIDCGLCQKACGLKTTKMNEYNQKYFEVKAKDTLVREKSRSGATFFCMAEKMISENGVVYGVSCDLESCKVAFIRAENIYDCEKMQGSKYVEARIENIYLEVKKDLLEGKKVLFSGTACQVAGLISYLQIFNLAESPYLLTMDIVCHGVPSSKVYNDYLEFLKNKYNGNVKKFNFRDKTYGWDEHVETFVVNYKKHTLDLYKGLFYSNYFLRPCCGKCKFANYSRVSDITIADFVGNERVQNNLNDNKGISVVMVNTYKGKQWFDKILEMVDFFELTKEQCWQPNLSHPSIIPDDREKVWEYYLKYGFKKMLVKYGRYDILHRIKWMFIEYYRLKKKLKR